MFRPTSVNSRDEPTNFQFLHHWPTVLSAIRSAAAISQQVAFNWSSLQRIAITTLSVSKKEPKEGPRKHRHQ
jgi:hypothetical protein